MARAQNYPLPTIPFNRDIENGLDVGSLVNLTAKVYQDRDRIATISLKNNANECALHIEFTFNDESQKYKLKFNCILDSKPSTVIEKEETMFTHLETFLLSIQVSQYAFQINLNGTHFVDFVHRIPPKNLTKISIDGPIICEEVRISNSSSIDPPTSLMSNLSLSRTNDEEFPPPPPCAYSITPTTTNATNNVTTSEHFNYNGGPQGFSGFPVPLPGLVDANNQSSSHPAPTTQTAPSPTRPTNTNSIPTHPANTNPAPVQTTPIAQPTYQNTYYPQNSSMPSTPLQSPNPYIVTYPPSIPPTPQNNQCSYPMQPPQQYPMPYAGYNPYANGPPAAPMQMFSPPPPPPPPAMVIPNVQYVAPQMPSVVYYSYDYYPCHRRRHH